jgi:2,4-dichlorophenol 6-monooxygenase
METFETDVLVVGAGPAGLTVSALLARARTRATIITKYPGTADSPRAHITNQRTARQALLASVDLMNYQFNAHGVELGQRYRSTAIASSEPFPEYSARPGTVFSARRGTRSHIPHVWVQRDGAVISTLDVCDYSRFTLIVGAAGHGWDETAAIIASELGVSIECARIGLRQDFDDMYGEWINIREVTDRGCLLVRPDRFIAWRSRDLPSDPVAALRRAMLSILGRGGLH